MVIHGVKAITLIWTTSLLVWNVIRCFVLEIFFVPVKLVHTKSRIRFKIHDIGKNTQPNHFCLIFQFHVKHRCAIFAIAQHFVSVDVVHIYSDQYMHGGGLKSPHIRLITLWMNFDLEEEALVPIINLAKNVHSSMWVSTRNGCKVKTNLYTTTMDNVVSSIFQQQFYHFLKFGSIVGTWPIEINLFLRVASCSLNLDKFVKVVCNVVLGSPLHSKGIGLEVDTHSMFMKKKNGCKFKQTWHEHFHNQHTHEKLPTYYYA